MYWVGVGRHISICRLHKYGHSQRFHRLGQHVEASLTKHQAGGGETSLSRGSQTSSSGKSSQVSSRASMPAQPMSSSQNQLSAVAAETPNVQTNQLRPAVIQNVV